MAIDYIPERIVSNSATWTDRIISQDITIEPGVILTVKGDVLMGENAKIVVKPGAELIVDGGTITNIPFCNNENKMWKGIQVWGQSNESQYGQPCAQGKLILKNGASIENAIYGVFVGAHLSDGTFDLTKSGGIVQVMGNNSLTEPSASFINNEWAVTFTPYRNFQLGNPEIELANLSYFKNALFMVNNEYHYAPWYKEMVRLYGINNINFSGCTFSNLTNDRFGIGLYTHESGFRLKTICTDQIVPCPKNLLDKCTFDNFYKGIDASDAGIYTFKVDDAVFNNNSYGIKMTAVNNATILSSTFNIGGPGVEELQECGATGASAYGIYANNCAGFAIEENYFTKVDGVPSGNYVGILIAESQSTDQVYKNTFEGLSYGNYAIGVNWQDNYFKGLAYFCNENIGNFADFFVEPDNDEQKISGIQSKQGDDAYVAGNTFSSSGTSWHFFNGGDYLVGYYYCNYCDDESPDESKVFQVTEKPKNFSNNCPSHYGSGSIESSVVLTTSEKQEAEMEFAVNLSNYTNVKTLYDNLKDGGNTDAVIADIESAWPSEMWELRAELLGKSPHLSMEVLKTAADKTDVLPESIIFEVMAANPDELQKEELIKYLEDKENPLPESMINILRQVAEGTTYKTALEQQMARYNQIKTRAAYDIIRSLINDTIIDFDQLRNWFDNVGGKRADEQIIALYLTENNYTNALSLANMMPTLYAYSGDELTEHSYYMDMLNLKINLEQQQRTIFDLDSLEVANLVNIAELSNGIGGAQAKGILEFAYGYHFFKCLNVSDTAGYKSSRAINPYDLAKVYGLEISTQPNPASEWVAINYTLPANANKGVIKIVDAKGVVITSFTVSDTKGQQVWDTRSVKPGAYFYTLIVGEFTKSGKIVINK